MSRGEGRRAKGGGEGVSSGRKRGRERGMEQAKEGEREGDGGAHRSKIKFDTN